MYYDLSTVLNSRGFLFYRHTLQRREEAHAVVFLLGTLKLIVLAVFLDLAVVT